MTESCDSLKTKKYFDHRDLTNTFEALLNQREESFNSRERDIGIQVSALDRKFEVLQTENSRLKLEVLEWQRKMESTSDEAAAKAEQLRLLQWRMDDERNMKQQGDDQDKRRMNQLSSDLSAARDRAAHDALEIEKLTEKVRISTFMQLKHAMLLLIRTALSDAIILSCQIR